MSDRVGKFNFSMPEARPLPLSQPKPPLGMKSWVARSGWSPTSQWKKGVQWAHKTLKDPSPLKRDFMVNLERKMRSRIAMEFNGFKRIIIPSVIYDAEPEQLRRARKVKSIAQGKRDRPTDNADVVFWDAVVTVCNRLIEDWLESPRFTRFMAEVRTNLLDTWYNMHSMDESALAYGVSRVDRGSYRQRRSGSWGSSDRYRNSTSEPDRLLKAKEPEPNKVKNDSDSDDLRRYKNLWAKIRGSLAVSEGNGVSVIAYHGTSSDFDPDDGFVEDPNGGRYIDSVVPHGGIWFSESKADARSFAMGGKSRSVIKVRISMSNPYVIPVEDYADEGISSVPDTDLIRRGGHDGIVVMRGEWVGGGDSLRIRTLPTWYAMLDPTKIRVIK